MTQTTQTDADFLFKEETDLIIGGFYKVYRALGYGFLERVYQNALYYELLDRGLDCKVQQPIRVYYQGHLVGEYIADMLIEDKIILELKAVKDLADEHEAQLINYLKSTRIEVGLLLNFGSRPQVKRKIFRNMNK
ncbi:MAG TPA: GxxExxY protein [Candidatus Parabacteroides intestinigallinarum]|uniref:GxxExxY protein n=1 Tax=Candidatus Parabacteroides intestinigallinarum TaxID=2838722 RepID=A0A9D1XRK4_9BACT|nr:GxxExxY protein [Candidatus Parabacteroides intestinigallinarum]